MNSKEFQVLSNWEIEIEECVSKSNAMYIALFSDKLELLFANKGMHNLLKKDIIKSFINPTLNRLLENPFNTPIIFEGLMTIGDESYSNATIISKVYRKKNQILIIGEMDVKQLTDQNEIMLKLNNENSSLQRQLIKEKKFMEITMNQFKELNATKDKFFSIIAHDLKSPFSSIVGYTELLSENYRKFDNDKVEKYINNVYIASKQAFNLVENLLLWAQSQKGSIEFNPEIFKLQTLSDEIISLIENQASKKKISVINKISHEITILADKNMISTVIRNLLTNAIKFTPHGGVVNINSFQNPDYTEISVIDTGIGMTKETADNLFKIDTQITTKGTDNEKGTGLGLIICREFIEKHRGKIWVESVPGKGSAFYFAVPSKSV